MDRLSQTYQGISAAKKQAFKRPKNALPSNPPSSASKQANSDVAQDEKKCHVSAKEAIGAFGLGVQLGWIVHSYFSTSFFSLERIEQVANHEMMRFIGIGVFGVMFVIFLIKSDYLATADFKKLSVLTMALGLVLPVCALLAFFNIPLSPIVLYLVWALNGFVIACAFLMWANYYSGLRKEIIVFSIVIACLAASCWYFLIMFLPEIIQIIAISVSLPLSIGCLRMFVGESAVLEFVSRKDSETIIGLDMRTSISLTAGGLANGYLLFKIVFEQPVEALFIIEGALLLNAALAFVLNKLFGPYALLIAPALRYGFPFLVVGFILLPFLGGVRLAICEMLLLAILFEQWIAAFVNMSFAIQKYKIQAFYLWTRVNMTVVISCAIGWGIALIVYSLIRNGSLDVFTATLVMSLTIVVVFALTITITPYGIDHLTVEKNFKAEACDDDEVNSKKAWWEACRVIARQATLTPRETEVFMLLAKGRNSKIIERELSISTHTVKSHNYNIYRKVGVESQQELIDTIELSRSELKDRY